jgi:hypothetical protein
LTTRRTGKIIMVASGGHAMRTKIAGLTVIAFAVAALLAAPTGLAAKEKRGATLLVTRTDGQLLEGELIAVRPDSLVLLSPSGADVSVGSAEIVSVRIVRPSKIGKGALWGGASGVLVGGLLGGLSNDIDYPPRGLAIILGSMALGAFGGLGGLGIGTLMSVDTVVPFAGAPDETVRARMEKLRGYSREYRLGGGKLELRVSPPPAPTPRPPVRSPEAVGSEPPPPRRAFRFRVRLPYTFGFSTGRGSEPRQLQTSFRFLDSLPDPGPFTLVVPGYSFRGDPSGFDSVSLGFEFSGHWAADLEIVFAEWSDGWFGDGYPLYESASDGKTYAGHLLVFSHETRFSAALLGLTYRPIAPTEFRRHIVEAGMAIGPAWARSSLEGFVTRAALDVHKLTLAARAHIAYDFYVIPSLSFGAAFGYRYFHADIPALWPTGTVPSGLTEIPRRASNASSKWASRRRPSRPAGSISACGRDSDSERP